MDKLYYNGGLLQEHMVNDEKVGVSQHGFIRGKYLLKDLVTYYNGVTALVDKGSATDIISLDLCKTFDVKHDILVFQL